MIHNIMEEREKRYRQGSPPPVPFTEEELARLIEQVEEREFIHAPAHLKENVFRRIDRRKKAAKNRQLFSYRVKVLVGMAAALAVLFLVPADGTERLDAPQKGILGSLLPEETEDSREWEQEAIDRQRDKDRVWAKYQKEQEKADARKRYYQNIREKIINSGDWED